MSITPAFSHGPWITQGALVGSRRRWIFEDLYEQCSFHMAEKMPSSVKVGARPIKVRMRSYSSDLSPWAATRAGVTLIRSPPRSFACLAPAFFVFAAGFDPAFFRAALRSFAPPATGRFPLTGLDVMGRECHCRACGAKLGQTKASHNRSWRDGPHPRRGLGPGRLSVPIVPPIQCVTPLA